jgi:hypothetical protein
MTPMTQEETSIKPGDVVRCDRWCGNSFVGVVAVVTAPGWIAMAFPVQLSGLIAMDWMEAGGADGVAYLGHADDDALRAALLTVAALPSPGGNAARQEALARGWRALDREDVTERAMATDILLGGERIGYIEHRRARERYDWTLCATKDGPTLDGRASTYDEALGALLAAENARRTQEGK